MVRRMVHVITSKVSCGCETVWYRDGRCHCMGHAPPPVRRPAGGRVHRRKRAGSGLTAKKIFCEKKKRNTRNTTKEASNMAQSPPPAAMLPVVQLYCVHIDHGHRSHRCPCRKCRPCHGRATRVSTSRWAPSERARAGGALRPVRPSMDEPCLGEVRVPG